MKGNLFRLPFVCLKCFHICAILLKSLFTGLIGCFFFIRVFQHINFLNTHLSVGGYRYGKRDIQIRLRIANTRCIYNALRSCFIIYDSFEHGLCQEVGIHYRRKSFLVKVLLNTDSPPRVRRSTILLSIYVSPISLVT